MLEFNSGRIALGGHRGCGANVWNASGPVAGKPRKYRENTVTSFLAAAQAGATFVEFDVQVTADNVPVLFHDNFIVFGDASSPSSSMVRALSLADFKGIAPINSNSDIGSSLAGYSDDEATSTARLAGDSPLGGSSPLGLSPRNNSTGRLLRKHQNDAPAKPFEPSLHPWEVTTEDDLPTLAEVFSAVPMHVAFDIEVKMTTPDDVECTPPEEVERVVNAILAGVDAAEFVGVGGRHQRAIMFSSFDPEVCIELKIRRPEFPVMFLSGGGAYPHVDRRRTSVSGAIEFATSAALDGVILESFVLKQDPGAVAAAHHLGLVVMTYGVHNDDDAWVQEQERLGVHAVIVDDVEKIGTTV